MIPFLDEIIQENIFIAWLFLAVGFYILAKCASVFVDTSVHIAFKAKLPKLVVGIVLVSLATTAPELAVSLMSVAKGNPEMALGNAVGSVICDDGLALALCGIIAGTSIRVIPGVLRTSGIMLVVVQVLLFLFVVFDFTLERWEGGVLLLFFALYLYLLVQQHKKGAFQIDVDLEQNDAPEEDKKLEWLIFFFILSTAGIIIASEFIITSAEHIALAFNVPQGVIALTLIAFGTSIPEVATCITAARKNQASIAVGNVIGADVLNICWVAGASALANNLQLQAKTIYFMFPSMFLVVGAMLLMLRFRYSLTPRKSYVLLAMYVAYLVSFFFVFQPTV